MADVLVTCVTRQNHPTNSHKGITHLGGTTWRWPKSKVIQSILDKTNTFYTVAGGRRADVGVVNDPDGPYLRTHADGVWSNNLLALATCRV